MQSLSVFRYSLVALAGYCCLFLQFYINLIMVEDRSSCKELDQWIDQLMECKQLAENQVKTICDKVSR